MEYHTDRRVVLNQDSEFKNLYKWSLQELDGGGRKIGRDQIPWAWNLYFTASELSFSDTIEIESDYLSDNDDTKMAVRERQSIAAKLRPGDSWGDRQTSYSMFGTDRTISDFGLAITKLKDGDEQEHCAVWGSVSYTSEVDFIDETTDDTVIFYLYVRPETFARYAERIASSQVDEVVLRVSGVAGFYSDWSPSIRTGQIKVLTSHQEHDVDMPDDCEIVPPRLGTVGEAELCLRSIKRLGTAKDEANEEGDDWFKEDELTGDKCASNGDAQAGPRLASAKVRVVTLITSLRTAAWVIAALLFLILIT